MIGLLGALYVFSVMCIMLRWAFFSTKDTADQPQHGSVLYAVAGLCVFVLAALLSLVSLERVVTHELRRLYFGADIPVDQFIAHSCHDHYRNWTKEG
jgi:hypothetical protein